MCGIVKKDLQYRKSLQDSMMTELTRIKGRGFIVLHYLLRCEEVDMEYDYLVDDRLHVLCST